MAPLPSNSTACLFLDYSTCGVEHTLLCRYDSPGSTAEAMDRIDAFLTALDPGLTELTVIGARNREVGSNITLPIAWTGAATYGGTLGPRYKGAAYLDFVGRDTAGRRARVAVFGPGDFFDTANEDYRFTTTDSAVIADAVDVLLGSANSFLSISSEVPLWYPYANTGVNAYWRNRIR